MRPYFVLCAVLLISAAAFGQAPVPRPYGPYSEFGPYVPLISTPMISFQTVSPNPVGASNATTGLIAGATNSTLSQIQGSTSSEFTVPVWYQGGAPLLQTPQVSLWPKPLGREMRAMAEPLGARERGPRTEERAEWVFITGSEHTTSVAEGAKPSVKAGHSYTNEDVTRQNDNNGMVKYDSKTEKIQ